MLFFIALLHIESVSQDDSLWFNDVFPAQRGLVFVFFQ